MKKSPNWGASEITFISLIGESMPLQLAIASFQREATKRGWPPRTDKAVCNKLEKMGLSYNKSIITGDLVGPGGVAAILGCSPRRVGHWIDRYTELLQPVWAARKRYVSRKNWRLLAQERPELFGGHTARQLFELLEDKGLADDIAKRFPHAWGHYRVRCVETRRTWPSARAAAADLFVSVSTIRVAIAYSKAVPSLGLRFERVHHK